ncbi:MAG: thioredoxin [Anaerolineae bacterium]|nr:thioredoxin [Anaerolineae bacterium]
MPVYDTPLITNDHSLDRVVKAGLPVALLIWDARRGLPADLEAALKQVARDEAGSLLVARLDAAENPQSAARYGADAPALVLFKDGQSLDGPVVGLTPQRLRAYVDYLLGRGAKPAAPEPAAASKPAASRPVTVTDATFQQEVFSSSVPVVVDFWAPWCGPCQMIGPVLERIAAEYGGRVKIAKVNVDENQQYAGQYEVRGIPTLLIVKQGQVVDRLVGALPEQSLRQRIQAHLS